MNWVKYFDRTYTQIKSSILTRMQSDVPEITDHTEGNLWVRLIGIWAGLTEMLGYYVDNTARESFLVTTRLYDSAVKIANAYDYRIKSKVASTVDIKFTLSVAHVSDIVIPINTICQNSNGLQFLTVEALTIATGSLTGVVGAKQIVAVTGVSIGTGDGLANQTIKLVSTDIADGTLVVYVNAVAWAFQETLGYSLYTDKHFVQTINKDKKVIINFGDGITGLIPPNGQAITADYYTTNGENVNANTITVLVGITPPSGITITITNELESVGGIDIEDLESVQQHAPKSLRTLLRGVNEQDYTDLAELVSGVSVASVDFNCGKTIDLYIVPDGGGLASTVLMGAVDTDLDKKEMVTTDVNVKAAGEVHISLGIDLKVLSGFDSTTVSAEVKTNLIEFISFKHQEIDGSLQLSDVYEIIESVEGVDYSNITKMSSTPYAHLVAPTTTPLNWSVVTLSTSNVIAKWSVIFTSSTIYQLYKDNAFVGNYTTGNLVTNNEIQFTINADTYIIGDQYSFVSYAYFGTIELDEPSLLVSINSDITIALL